MSVVIGFTKTANGYNKKHADNLKEKLDQLPPGNYVIQISPNDIKTNAQGRYWAVLKIIFECCGHEPKELHEEYKKMYNEGRSTRMFKSDKEWWDYVDKVVMHGRTFHNAIIPDKRDMDYQRMLEIEESFNRCYK